ncbi:MAG: 1-acyl-sn-glycerol-3-phosphate acyltransferase [Candidatus Nomurabacteria bacterium]|nr:MAG: 1-acyl-sn-glycerol-3-phosphate acyltransferase [Candidatus Nomurabacteria bacterium]
MSRPKVTLENYEEVYDWYANYYQPRRATKLAYSVLNRRFNPEVHYEPGALDEFSDFRRSDTPQIFALNHLTNTVDQFVASSFAYQAVPEDVGRTRVMAKDELFRKSYRRFIDLMGAIPTYRMKDHAQMEGGEELVRQSNDMLIDTCGIILASGQNLGVFVEGSHNKVDPAVVQTVRSGFARTAFNALSRGVSTMVTPVGMSFGTSLENLDPRQAVLVVGRSIPVTTEHTEDSLIASTATALQTAVDRANEIRSTRTN